MKLLAIETSCDETSAAVVVDGHDVRASVVASQVAAHAGYGGVVPELAAREHLRNIDIVVRQAFAESDCQPNSIDAVAATTEPGLVPALLVGVSYGKGFAAAAGIPFTGVNHFLAHIYGALLSRPEIRADAGAYPLLALVVSGGHTALVVIERNGQARIVGTTLDDAAGEAFDKAAKILGLGYPGGPIIDNLAVAGDSEYRRFPRGLLRKRHGKPLCAKDRFNFSFSGLKTALFYDVRDNPPDAERLPDIAASYQAAIVEVLAEKTFDAAAEFAILAARCG